MALTKTVQYYLARYELVFSRRGFVDGASYTDVHAQLPALNLLMVISIAAAALFIANIFRKGWVFPIIAVGLWAFISLVVGTIYPAVIQRFVVQPNEFSREAAVHRTQHRDARAPRSGSTARRSRPRTSTTHQPRRSRRRSRRTRRRSTTSGCGTRRRRRRSSAAQQERFPYYRFVDVDADRYKVGADEQAAMVALARARCRQHPGPHVDEPAPRVHARVRTGRGGREPPTTQGEPSYLVSDIPSTGELADSSPDQPGHLLRREPVRVRRRRHQGRRAAGRDRRDQTEETRYQRRRGRRRCRASCGRARSHCASATGTSSCRASSPTNSRVLYKRDIRERVRTAAPFLKFDADPYPVVVEQAHPVGHRRVHDLGPVSVLAVDPPEQPARRQRPRHRVQLRAQLGEGDGRRVRRHDQVLRRQGRRTTRSSAAYQKAFPELFTSAGQDARRAARATGATPKTCSAPRRSSSRCTT